MCIRDSTSNIFTPLLVNNSLSEIKGWKKQRNKIKAEVTSWRGGNGDYDQRLCRIKAWTVVSVSYTHLDVYKRQVCVCVTIIFCNEDFNAPRGRVTLKSTKHANCLFVWVNKVYSQKAYITTGNPTTVTHKRKTIQNGLIIITRKVK